MGVRSRFLKVGDRSKDTAFEAVLGEGGEEALDGVEAGGRCRGEVDIGMIRESYRNGALQHFSECFAYLFN
jgi:hypothetical protein